MCAATGEGVQTTEYSDLSILDLEITADLVRTVEWLQY